MHQKIEKVIINGVTPILTEIIREGIGASTFKFAVDPLSAYLFSPLMMIGSVLVATMLGITGAGRMKLSDNIKE